MSYVNCKLAASRNKYGQVSIDAVRELTDWLTGDTESQPLDKMENTEGCFQAGESPKMDPEKVKALIWWLQEVLHIIPDSYECCDWCGAWFDTGEQGDFIDKSDSDLRAWIKKEFGRRMSLKGMDGNNYCGTSCMVADIEKHNQKGA